MKLHMFINTVMFLTIHISTETYIKQRINSVNTHNIKKEKVKKKKKQLLSVLYHYISTSNFSRIKFKLPFIMFLYV